MEGTELGDNMEKIMKNFYLWICHSTRYHDTDENNTTIPNIKSYDNEFDDDIF